MRADLKPRIIKRNRDRGLLGSFDPALELKMLSEEANEFYMAETLEHMIAEYCDFIFVSEGTRAKYQSTVLSSHSQFSLSRESWIELRDWIAELSEDMEGLIQEYFINGGPCRFESLMDFAMETVISNNELKGTEKVNGKIVKSDKQVDPTIKIEEYLYGN